jgi:hypothetical protein
LTLRADQGGEENAFLEFADNDFGNTDLKSFREGPEEVVCQRAPMMIGSLRFPFRSSSINA